MGFSSFLFITTALIIALPVPPITGLDDYSPKVPSAASDSQDPLEWIWNPYSTSFLSPSSQNESNEDRLSISTEDVSPPPLATPLELSPSPVRELKFDCLQSNELAYPVGNSPPLPTPTPRLWSDYTTLLPISMY